MRESVVHGILQRLGVYRDSDRHWAVEILIFTRHWIHYGWMAFVLILSLTAAAEGLLGR
ncbi:MAG: hypothetical protein HY820_01655 [Acidobacteria bacterium]|nr:hypothetical protein [Acidobacteriota bacterium]